MMHVVNYSGFVDSVNGGVTNLNKLREDLRREYRYAYMYVYIYIYRERDKDRERERERERREVMGLL